MKGFILGIVTMILILGLGLVFALMGFINMRADVPPSPLEAAIAGRAMDAGVERAAPNWRILLQRTRRTWPPELASIATTVRFVTAIPPNPKRRSQTPSILLRRSSPMTWPTCQRTRIFTSCSTAFAGPPCLLGKTF